MMKEARELKKRQAKLNKVKTDRGDLGSGGDSSFSKGRKERRVKVRKVKKSSVVRKANSKRVKDRDSDSNSVSVNGKTRAGRKIRAKNEKAKDIKQANKKKKKKKGTKAEFIRVNRLWSKDKHRYILEKSSEHTEAGEYK